MTPCIVAIGSYLAALPHYRSSAHGNDEGLEMALACGIPDLVARADLAIADIDGLQVDRNSSRG